MMLVEGDVMVEMGKGMLEQLPGYALILLVLIPLIRVMMAGQAKLQASRDSMLEAMLQNLITTTRSLEVAVDTFKAFETNETSRHMRLDAALERLAIAIDQVFQQVKRQ